MNGLIAGEEMFNDELSRPSKGENRRAIAVRVIDYPDRLDLPALLSRHHGIGAFTSAERRLCASSVGVERWASRLCAKLAVREILSGASEPGSIALSDIELLRGVHPEGAEPQPSCALGHPPLLVLHRRAAELARNKKLSVSISHCATASVAIAVAHQLTVPDPR